MARYIEGRRVPIKAWLDDLEDSALEQALTLSELPFAFSHIALMPDCHSGIGMPIGGVLATNDVVVPCAVGVDISCGMSFLRTSLKRDLLSDDDLVKIINEVKRTVPVGFSHREVAIDSALFTETPGYPAEAKEYMDIPVIRKEARNSELQLGTLGGGNHFIELQVDTDGFICIMVHSGSRNIGYKIAKTYQEIAENLCKKWYSAIPNNGLSFLPIDSAEGKEYMKAIEFADKFARESRCIMVSSVVSAIQGVIDRGIATGAMFNVNHNYARIENHFGKNVMVHRKGATSARLGEYGIIPGSQGTCSFIVEGKGNKDSFMSCSHGAGRRMGRKEASRTLSLSDELEKMRKAGVLHGILSTNDLDEAPGAYKDINEVMSNQADLVKIVDTLRPVAVVKG